MSRLSSFSHDPLIGCQNLINDRRRYWKTQKERMKGENRCKIKLN